MNKSGLVLVLAAMFVSGFLQAQSMTVISENSVAVDCYNRSVQAVSSRDARFADIETCDAAINNVSLSSRDLLATLINRGVIYGTLGRFDRAAEDYNRAIGIASDVPEVYLNRGNLRFLTEDWSEAISDYNQAEALGLIPAHVLHLNRGMAYENSGRLSEAETDYMDALELAPNWQPALEKLQRVEASRLEQPASTINQPSAQ